MSFNLFSLDTSLRPRLACELSPEGVVAARPVAELPASAAFAPLFSGALVPSLKSPNILDKHAVGAAIKRVLDSVEGRDKRLTLVVPDAAARVLILDFDTLPSKPAEALPVVRFRLRKLVPFEVDTAAVSYQVMQQSSDEARVLVTAMPHDVLAEYEEVIRLAGYEPGTVLPSTLATLAAITESEPTLFINRNGNSVTTAITRGDELLLHRSLDLPADTEQRADDLRQAISVSIAYFEDTLHSIPDTVFYAGSGGTSELSEIAGIEQFRVRDVVPAGAATASVPRGLMAGVTGALAS